MTTNITTSGLDSSIDTDQQKCDTDRMNKLLRGELSAVAAYEQAISKFEDLAIQKELSRIRAEHSQAVTSLQQRIQQFGGKPEDSAGAWGSFTSAVTETAKVIGPKTVLAALKRGEELGIGDYEDAIENSEISQSCKTLLQSKFLPACRKHVLELDHLIPRV
ncbi:DUF2383 domain-containing protein [Telmatocola sphagniphila]|uniref:DUF2383 domain-containing protein n=1 Tax=Telmatocola sphagniphila TaxID=1123043 RepID=A0A8E6BBA1_9BACT|nr:DUF2383 domain-containing protein [Telmatocola sphagniphila]QVL34566.1 DUF2383 domain-containing protein [Telmatocola sphagniphila]